MSGEVVKQKKRKQRARDETALVQEQAAPAQLLVTVQQPKKGKKKKPAGQAPTGAVDAPPSTLSIEQPQPLPKKSKQDRLQAHLAQLSQQPLSRSAVGPTAGPADVAKPVKKKKKAKSSRLVDHTAPVNNDASPAEVAGLNVTSDAALTGTGKRKRKKDAKPDKAAAAPEAISVQSAAAAVTDQPIVSLQPTAGKKRKNAASLPDAGGQFDQGPSKKSKKAGKTTQEATAPPVMEASATAAAMADVPTGSSKKGKKGQQPLHQNGVVKAPAEEGDREAAAADVEATAAAGIPKKLTKKMSKQPAGTAFADADAPAPVVTEIASEADSDAALVAEAANPVINPVAANSIQAGRRGSMGRAESGGRSFQRVNAEEWLGKAGSRDNSYLGTFGNVGWGAKAQERLGQVRGKDFRHEKTKKKRGTYKGGAIDGGVRSFKYDSDDE